MMTEHWRERAICRGLPLVVFFRDGAGATYDAARAICQRCPVAAECLAYAMQHETDQRSRHGVWGGKSPRQRWHLARLAERAEAMRGEPDAAATAPAAA